MPLVTSPPKVQLISHTEFLFLLRSMPAFPTGLFLSLDFYTLLPGPPSQVSSRIVTESPVTSYIPAAMTCFVGCVQDAIVATQIRYFEIAK